MSRYWQQTIISEIGTEGQEKIGLCRLLIIGAGGLGTPVAAYLAAAGVGTITIVDGDIVSLSNLSRQFLFDDNKIGESKAKVLTQKLGDQNPGISINAHPEKLDQKNAIRLIEEHDIVCDCTDNAETRILIDNVCGQMNRPLIYAVVKDWEGYVTVLHHKRNVSLEDIFSAKSLIENAELNCSVAGIVNTTCGIAGSIQACEVLKIILGKESELDGGILCFNSLLGVFKTFKLSSSKS